MIPAALRRLTAPAPDVHELWQNDPGTRRAYLILAWLAFGFGVHLLASWPDRFQFSTYATIRESGGVLWGYAWLALAAALATCRAVGQRATYWALQTGGLLHFVWAVALFWAAWRDPNVAGLGTLLFFGLGVMHVSTALEHRERPPDEEGPPHAA